ncbi:type II toxin-antitoxin system HipA family toxin [Hyphomicrobium sp.]|uniref:type II toxin-antitoxin system HipA family toxin n=1 Tax=Hyphomicrobium sp. TaxID=82 RepID=UPI002E2F5918|nr:type II toxin-antitoxin system HipA family toxin [Hyphomicrobium sp.]HEX2842119.1 type II toxin-antitoxin system HipA family toxin [Hyphomicrobium sp.]
MSNITRLDVFLRFKDESIPVGTLATNGKAIFFEYLTAFIERQLHLSPFMLPLRDGLQHTNDDLFHSLPGVFNDSLPDGWGRLLLHQSLKQRGIDPASLGPLDELGMVGSTGMGALTYQPSLKTEQQPSALDLDRYASASQNILNGSTDHMLQQLRAAAGSSGGARPKVLVSVSADRTHLTTAPPADGEEEWLIKFPGSTDSADAGAIEYVYFLMAREAGITMSDCHLFPSHTGPGYFGTKRFDRVGGKRLHAHSLSGLVHDDFRHPSFDYENVLALTHKLTLNPTDVKAMYRLAVFNVLSHNRDDHSKNFSFLMDETGRWAASPAYDLTFSSGPNGFQSMSVMNEARHPAQEHLIALGRSVGFPQSEIVNVIEQVADALSLWPRFAKEHGVTSSSAKLVQNIISKAIALNAY